MGAVTGPAGRLLTRLRTTGSTGNGRTEWYGVQDLHALAAVDACWDGEPLGALAPVTPPVIFGFGSVPRPSVVRVTTTVQVPGRRSADDHVPRPWVGIVLAGVALYAALALELEGTRERTVLPVGRRGAGQRRWTARGRWNPTPWQRRPASGRSCDAGSPRLGGSGRGQAVGSAVGVSRGS